MRSRDESFRLAPLSSSVTNTNRAQVKLLRIEASAAPASPPVASDESDDDAGGPGADPVRIYLRQMGGRSLLTREQETTLARRIKSGEQQVLKAVLSNPVAGRELERIAALLRGSGLRVRDVRADVDEDGPDFVEEQVARQTVTSLETACRLGKRVERDGRALAAPRLTAARKKQLSKRLACSRDTLAVHVSDLSLRRSIVDEMVRLVKAQMRALDSAQLLVGSNDRSTALEGRRRMATLLDGGPAAGHAARVPRRDPGRRAHRRGRAR